jgi:hypothetical protein
MARAGHRNNWIRIGQTGRGRWKQNEASVGVAQTEGVAGVKHAGHASIKSIGLRPGTLAAIPVQFATIAIHVAVFAAELAAFMACSAVIPTIDVATQLAAIMRNPGLVVPDIPA